MEMGNRVAQRVTGGIISFILLLRHFPGRGSVERLNISLAPLYRCHSSLKSAAIVSHSL